MAVIAASCFLLLCNLPPTLVLWLAVVEEVFSGVIEGYARKPMWELACVGAGLPAMQTTRYLM
ncbi:hypothetical protein [Pseudomonas tolaasii]|uniref:hypothetical protein n=1 Tax=Pseudomonas tolaasii TaxID=29442 RepID=UPI001C5FAAF9|nr:hypothetical protein [Pseudomonas tolaasii]MBW4795155.1 hypothetical protein [Pseudomonas tolaasii]